LDDGFKDGVVFFSSDTLAQGGLAEAQCRRIEIPKQLALVGFGDQPYAAYTFPALSTVRFDRAQIGQCAAKALLARIDGKTVESSVIDVGFEIVELVIESLSPPDAAVVVDPARQGEPAQAVPIPGLFELRAELSKLFPQIGKFRLDFGHFRFQPLQAILAALLCFGRDMTLLPLWYRFSAQQLNIAGFFAAGLALQPGDQRFFPFQQVLQDRFDDAQIGEAVEALAAGPQFARRLRTPQQQHGHQSLLFFGQLEYARQVVAVARGPNPFGRLIAQLRAP
jgi:hypothetical protein